MGILTSILRAGKFLTGMVIGLSIIMGGFAAAETFGGDFGIVVIVPFAVVGAGFIFWAERSRQTAIAPKRRSDG
ncbi:hypothetical protein OB905_05625 [Halobacteria archaeon AArc-dxtr1]|nr:hypothetical protein [Halobacteria archaeon AArc-dxtr1]